MGQGAAAEARRRSGDYLVRRGLGGGTLPIGADRSTRRGQTLRTPLGHDALRPGAGAAGTGVPRFGQGRTVRGLEEFFDRRGRRLKLRRVGRAARPEGGRGQTIRASDAPALPRVVPRGNRADRIHHGRGRGRDESALRGVEHVAETVGLRYVEKFSCHFAPLSPQKSVEAMTGQPTSKPTCPSCGADVPPDAPRGYCLKCLFALGAAEPDSLAGTLSPSGGERRGEGRGSPLPSDGIGRRGAGLASL